DLRARLVGLDADRPVQLLDALLDRLERPAAPLGLGVVGDARLEAAVVGDAHRHGDARRRAAADRLIEQLADDRVDRHLRGLADTLGVLDVEVDPNLVGGADLLGDRAQRGPEALVAQHDRLEREREVAQLADRRPVPVEGGAEHAEGVVELARLDRVDRRVEHQGDAGKVLNGAVVQEQRDAPPLVLLGRDQPVEGVIGQSMMASRSAIATACVRVSASSFVRMCRTWLLTVSCEMNSRWATSAFDMPSASSCRISRSREVSMSVWSLPARNAGGSAGST